MKNKIKTKEELIEHLKKYKGVLNNSIISYLYSLINLEFSVIKEYISEDDRIVLNELEVYKNIAQYNIYNRALNIFNDNKSKFLILGNQNKIEGLSVDLKLGENDFKIFNFDYCDYFNKDELPNFYKSTFIGCISLFETIADEKRKEDELNRIMTELEKLYSQKNPYPYEPGYFGGPRPQWEFQHSRKIYLYENMFNELDSKKGLTDDDKKEIEVTNKYNKLLLNDYGLTNDSFKEEKINNYELDRHNESGMQKKLIKKIPGITIRKKIKYI